MFEVLKSTWQFIVTSFVRSDQHNLQIMAPEHSVRKRTEIQPDYHESANVLLITEYDGQDEIPVALAFVQKDSQVTVVYLSELSELE